MKTETILSHRRPPQSPSRFFSDRLFLSRFSGPPPIKGSVPFPKIILAPPCQRSVCCDPCFLWTRRGISSLVSLDRGSFFGSNFFQDRQPQGSCFSITLHRRCFVTEKQFLLTTRSPLTSVIFPIRTLFLPDGAPTARDLGSPSADQSSHDPPSVQAFS